MPNAKMNCFVDTMLLVYAIDPGNPTKQQLAADLLRAIVRGGTLVLSAQSLNEFYRVAIDRRSLLSREEARAEVTRLARFCTAPYNFDVTQDAWRIQDEHGFSYWDCVLLASAALADCNVFFSEDLQHERRVHGLTIIDPFRTGAGNQRTI
jgi:predicted nucleic acid-binding protein